ncbi:uncharacterized protein LOC116349980 isoform X2 [Contarinia nasturtii]|uniref:uncharacterized protein LOC116349980 isoform X2 n=1 Tax=Contarinia nasturtii TaxID=265458 RepID=UPI0012D3FB45|nr:uncharacterized protein LOC116349980 isoform X2 [Contarinia nasturtii]XP_031637548.1 uncharacterized protein LOC116349980 isoform X2 [Contarinia nasturtii]XP_031637549.1 uncharacterized protein LOC116349980 isoform X2 [Contarinia nasturtii]
MTKSKEKNSKTMTTSINQPSTPSVQIGFISPAPLKTSKIMDLNDASIDLELLMRNMCLEEFESRDTTAKNAPKKKHSPEVKGSKNNLSDSNSTSESTLGADSHKPKKPKRESKFNTQVSKFNEALSALKKEAAKEMLDSKGDDLIIYFKELKKIRKDVLTRLKKECDAMSTFIKWHNEAKDKQIVSDLDTLVDGVAATISK